MAVVSRTRCKSVRPRARTASYRAGPQKRMAAFLANPSIDNLQRPASYEPSLREYLKRAGFAEDVILLVVEADVRLKRSLRRVVRRHLNLSPQAPQSS